MGSSDLASVLVGNAKTQELWNVSITILGSISAVVGDVNDYNVNYLNPSKRKNLSWKFHFEEIILRKFFQRNLSKKFL